MAALIERLEAIVAKTKTVVRNRKVARLDKMPDTAKILVVNTPDTRKGSRVDRVWHLIAKSKTIGAYKAARKAAKMSDSVGGILGMFVHSGNVRIGR